MATIFTARTGRAGACRRYGVKAACFSICLAVFMLSIGVHAERTVMATWQGVSGFHTFLSGHQVRLMVFEAGAPTIAGFGPHEHQDHGVAGSYAWPAVA